jgi:hypothetical protein
MARTNKKQAEQVESPVETAVAEETGESVNPITKAGYFADAIMEEHKTKSAAIRFLASKGFKTGDIAKFLPGSFNGHVRYQHVRNVLNQKPKKVQAPVTSAEAGE